MVLPASHGPKQPCMSPARSGPAVSHVTGHPASPAPRSSLPRLPVSSGPPTAPLCGSRLFATLRVCATPSFTRTDGPWEARWRLSAGNRSGGEPWLKPQPAGEPCRHRLFPRSPTPRPGGPPRNHGDSSGPPRGLGHTLLLRTEAKHDRHPGGDHVARVRSAGGLLLLQKPLI